MPVTLNGRVGVGCAQPGGRVDEGDVLEGENPLPQDVETVTSEIVSGGDSVVIVKGTDSSTGGVSMGINMAPTLLKRVQLSPSELAKIKFRQAVVSDSAKIISLIEEHRKFDELKTKGVSFSPDGFLFAELSLSECEDLINNEMVFVLERESRVIGVVVGVRPENSKYESLNDPVLTWYDDLAREVYSSGNYVYMWIVAVDKDFHGCGLGRMMVNEFKQKARSDGKQHVIVDFMSSPVLNRASEGLFTSQGFKKAGALILSDYYGAGVSEWTIYHFELR